LIQPDRRCCGHVRAAIRFSQGKEGTVSTTTQVEGNRNGEVLAGAYKAFISGDLAALTDILDPDVTLHVAGENWLAGDYAGRDAALGFFGSLFSYSEGTVRLDVHDVIAGDSYVVGLHRSHAGRGDRAPVTTDNVLIARVVDQRITAVWINPWKQKEEAEFFGASVPDGLSAPQRVHTQASSWTAEQPG
jgi:ketosteroid isomerase-like protein